MTLSRSLFCAMTLEIIVTDAQEAVIAERAGATQLELVAEQGRGGLTPAPSTIEQVVKSVTIPVHVIVRPHDEGFHYAAHVRTTITQDARRAAELGASAIVVGGLDDRGDVDVDLIAQVYTATGIGLTFHRAFDDARDPLAAYDTLAHVPGVTRVLTAGGAASAWEGREMLRTLCERPGPDILAAGGITLENVTRLVAATGVRDVHVGAGVRTGSRLDAQAIERIAAALLVAVGQQRG